MTLERSRTGISSPTSMGLSFGLCSMGWMKAGSTSPMAEKCDGSFFFLVFAIKAAGDGGARWCFIDLVRMFLCENLQSCYSVR